VDSIENIKGSVIQHGPHNNRIYLMGLNTDDTRGLIATLDDMANQNAEMTDFATPSKLRGMGFAGMLLKHMDQQTRKLGIKTAYTIARAASHGMNSVFKNSGYNYAGLLKNNSQICGSIQSMTVWYKHLTNLL